jgi:predicted phosphodiesterase
MKLHILSDLHVEFESFNPPETEAAVVILAGDIHVGKKGIDWAKASFSDKYVLYVLGNHEYYGRAFLLNYGYMVMFIRNRIIRSGTLD